jgi:hypothetical protein
MSSAAGLSGYFGHTFVVDENGHRRVQYQFRIVRRLPQRRWVIELYSFWDGTPNKLAVYSEDFLLGDDVALYRNEEIWRVEYDKAEQRYRMLSKYGAK